MQLCILHCKSSLVALGPVVSNTLVWVIQYTSCDQRTPPAISHLMIWTVYQSPRLASYQYAGTILVGKSKHCCYRKKIKHSFIRAADLEKHYYLLKSQLLCIVWGTTTSSFGLPSSTSSWLQLLALSWIYTTGNLQYRRHHNNFRYLSRDET